MMMMISRIKNLNHLIEKHNQMKKLIQIKNLNLIIKFA